MADKNDALSTMDLLEMFWVLFKCFSFFTKIYP